VEGALMTSFLTGIEEMYSLGLDTSPITDRPNIKLECSNITPAAIIVGGSNATKLCVSFCSLGKVMKRIARVGWTLSNASIATMAPELSSICAGVSTDVPV